MVFSSSLPAYLDTASNWNQNHQVIGSGSGNSLISSQQQHGGGPIIRPGSMAERARMANIPMPESALRCPRCDSTNTKFCYFNNYSLSQPRHFCKSCRRYWTKGGALRNVPVGGGCRRNKRSKSNAGKSQTRSERQNTAIPSSTAAGGGGGGLMPQLPPLRFIPQLPENFNTAPEMVGNDFLSGGAMAPLFSCNDEPWRFHHAPPQLGFMDPTPGFQHGESSFIVSDMMQAKNTEPLFNQVEPVKAEENPEMGGRLLGNDHWSNGVSSWTEFCSPSTSNRMPKNP